MTWKGRTISILLKTNAMFCRRGWRSHELSDGLEDDGELLVVLAKLAFEIGEFAGQVFVRRHNSAQADEGPHDRDVDFDGTVAIEDAGEHGHALFVKA